VVSPESVFIFLFFTQLAAMGALMTVPTSITK